MKITNPVERFVRWLLQPILRPREELAKLYRERTLLTLKYQDACHEISRLQKEVEEDLYWTCRRALVHGKIAGDDTVLEAPDVTVRTVRVPPMNFSWTETSRALKERGPHAQRHIQEKLAYEVAKYLVDKWDKEKLFHK